VGREEAIHSTSKQRCKGTPASRPGVTVSTNGGYRFKKPLSGLSDPWRRIIPS